MDDDDFVMDDPLSDNESMTSESIFSAGGDSNPAFADDDDAPIAPPAAPPFSALRPMEDPSEHYRQDFGRSLNSSSYIYQLPADEEELDRLERQYEMLNYLVGYKYPPPMQEILADDGDGVEKGVLDLGTGTGNWIIDVARDFPHCSALAVDLTPMKTLYEFTRSRPETLDETRRIPANLRSEIDDINLGLEHLFGRYLVVHARLIAIGVRDYYRLIDQIADVLLPGGLIDLSEVGYVAYDRNHRPIPVVDPTPGNSNWNRPYWAHWLRAVYNVARDRLGGDVMASRHLHDWIADHRAYEDVVYQEFWLPIIPGNFARPPEEADFLEKFRLALEYDVLSFLRSGRPMLLGAGYPETFLLKIERLIFEELREAKEPQYGRVECVYARKKHVIPPMQFDIRPFP